MASEKGECGGCEQVAIGLPDAGFHFAKAAESPEVLGEVVDQDLFDG